MLDKGVIVYGKSGWDIARGKIHGSLDTGLSVIATKPRDGRVDIDAEDCIYHLKVNFFTYEMWNFSIGWFVISEFLIVTLDKTERGIYGMAGAVKAA
jgi:hypothetical protein